MDEEMVEPQITDPTLPPLPPVEPPKRTKSLVLLAGVAVVLVTLGVGISMLGGGRKNVTSNTSETTTEKVADNIYQNEEYFYELTLPPKWRVQPTSADTQSMSFTTSGEALLTVKVVRQQGDLQTYLANLSGTKVNKSAPIRVGTYDGVEQQESWSSQGVQVVTAYIKVQDMIYTFTLLPTEGKNAVTNESVIREYKSVLASFKITDTSAIGKDWVNYSGKGWQIKYPQNWILKQLPGSVLIYRDNYEIAFTGSSVEPSVCIFRDSQAIEGYAGDLRDKEYLEFTTGEGLVLRRYFKTNQGDKSILYFCAKGQDDEQFSSPTTYGTIVYRVPAKYDNDILLEMDEIVKTMQGVDNE